MFIQFCNTQDSAYKHIEHIEVRQEAKQKRSRYVFEQIDTCLEFLYIIATLSDIVLIHLIGS